MSKIIPSQIFPEFPTTFSSSETFEFGFSTLDDGCMSLHRDVRKTVVTNRMSYFSKVGIRLEDTCWANLVHGTNVEFIDNSHRGFGSRTFENSILETDGLWTNTPNLTLCTTHADCLPLYCISTDPIAVGVAHCGWRSIVNGLPAQMVRTARDKLKVNVSSLLFVIGTGIRVECFEVSEPIVNQFDSNAIRFINQHWFVDLAQQINLQLEQSDVSSKQIFDSGICSKCTPLYSSFRRDQSEVAPSVAWIRILT